MLRAIIKAFANIQSINAGMAKLPAIPADRHYDVQKIGR